MTQIYRYGFVKEYTRRDSNELIFNDKTISIIIRNDDNEKICESIIDIEDYLIIKDFKWYLGNNGYLMSDSDNQRNYLHRLILNKPTEYIDHINRDKLDNRKCNLRLCNQSQNGYNRKLNKNNISGYKGVSWINDKRKFKSQIKNNYKVYFLGYYDTKEEAALAYNKKAIEFGKEFSTLNII